MTKDLSGSHLLHCLDSLLFYNNVDWSEFYENGRWRSVQTKYRDRIYRPHIHDIEFVH